ncbi:MAG: shikimate kinase [Galactobacter sp.]
MSATVPEDPRALVLVGPMGAGKTAVAHAYADLTGAEFVDLDQRIAAAHGPIPEIFAKGGEAAFRSAETEVLRAALAETGTVISAGGGIVHSQRNRDLLAGAFVVFLSIDQATASGRIRDAQSRPMLAGGDPMQVWQRILDERLPLYTAVATEIVDARSDTPEELAAQIATSYAMSTYSPTEASTSEAHEPRAEQERSAR